MKVVIIDYGAGNIFSVRQAFRRIGVETVLSADEKVIRSASHVVFPGVGHAKSAMEQLQLTGLDRVIPDLKQPVLGICLGMQLMCDVTEEGDTRGLGIFPTRVYELKTRIQKLQNFGYKELVNSGILKLKNSGIQEIENSLIRKFDNYRRTQENTRFQEVFSKYKSPHMGWNDVITDGNSETFYFVHSFAAEVCENTVGITEYPIPFSASLRKENFWGVQFHPEKSGKAGEELLKQFLES